MQLRTFLANDMKTALSQVRREMGAEAVIVASQQAKGGGVMVRAALEVAADALPEPPAPPLAEPEIAAHDFAARHRENLIRRLRAPAAPGAAPQRNFDRAQLLQLLGGHRTPETIAHDLAKTAEQSGLKDMTLALACALDRRMKSRPIDFAESAALLLLGPNGAGKTATAAKIAAHAKLIHRPVRLIAADTDGAGAIARLETFGHHLGAQTIVAESVDAIVKAIAGCAKDNALAIVDTPGFDPRHSKMRTAFAALAAIDGIEAVAVVSAAGDAEEIGEISQALAKLGCGRLVVTGLDLTRRFGTLACAATQGPALAHITRSAFVAGGLETLTPLSLSRLLIDAALGGADHGSPQ